jgi:hypothetical protein
MLVDYIIDYVYNLLSYFLKLINIIFDFFKNSESTGAQEPKALSDAYHIKI